MFTLYVFFEIFRGEVLEAEGKRWVVAMVLVLLVVVVIVVLGDVKVCEEFSESGRVRNFGPVEVLAFGALFEGFLGLDCERFCWVRGPSLDSSRSESGEVDDNDLNAGTLRRGPPVFCCNTCCFGRSGWVSRRSDIGEAGEEEFNGLTLKRGPLVLSRGCELVEDPGRRKAGL